jgi:hypothetical protein
VRSGGGMERRIRRERGRRGSAPKGGYCWLLLQPARFVACWWAVDV